MATIVPTAPLADLDLAAAKCFRRLTHQDETGTVGRRDRASDEEHAAITALPPAFRRRLMVTVDGAGANHGLLQHLHKLVSRPGYQLTYSLEWALTEREKIAIGLVPEQAWAQAIEPAGRLRERRADDACDNPSAHMPAAGPNKPTSPS